MVFGTINLTWFSGESYILLGGEITDTMNSTKILLGAVLLFVSSALLLYLGTPGANIPIVAGGAASLAMAAGALLVGTSEGGRPV